MTVALVALVAAVVSSPGWPRVHETFFSGEHAKDSFAQIWKGFWHYNVVIFLIAEPLILVLGLAVAVARQTRSPVMTPIRWLAVGYTDLLRGIPTLLLVMLLGFGMPALQLQGVPNSALFWAIAALVVSYGAYVAEVFGPASSRSTLAGRQRRRARAQPGPGDAVRRRPQAVRRVIPPLLNDFVSLQKDTALVFVVGVFDGVWAASDYGLYIFNYTPMVVVAAFFVVLTIPLARLTDVLQRRMAERERAGAR
ncbi:MAG: ABC transporter permease subunit [Nocardioides sp.]